MQPPNLRLAGWHFGNMCTTCRFFEVRDGKYWCCKYELGVRYSDLCDDYVWDGIVRVT